LAANKRRRRQPGSPLYWKPQSAKKLGIELPRGSDALRQIPFGLDSYTSDEQSVDLACYLGSEDCDRWSEEQVYSCLFPKDGTFPTLSGHRFSISGSTTTDLLKELSKFYDQAGHNLPLEIMPVIADWFNVQWDMKINEVCWEIVEKGDGPNYPELIPVSREFYLPVSLIHLPTKYKSSESVTTILSRERAVFRARVMSALVACEYFHDENYRTYKLGGESEEAPVFGGYIDIRGFIRAVTIDGKETCVRLYNARSDEEAIKEDALILEVRAPETSLQTSHTYVSRSFSKVSKRSSIRAGRRGQCSTQ